MRTVLMSGAALMIALSAIAHAQDKPPEPIPAEKGAKTPEAGSLTCPLWPIDWDPVTGLYYYYSAYNDDQCNFQAYTYIWDYNENAPVSPCNSSLCLSTRVNDNEPQNGEEHGRRGLPPNGRLQLDELPPAFKNNMKLVGRNFRVVFDHDGNGMADKVVRLYEDIEIKPRAACEALKHANCESVPETRMINIGLESPGNAANFPVIPRENVEDITQPNHGPHSKFIITIGEVKYLVFLRNL